SSPGEMNHRDTETRRRDDGATGRPAVQAGWRARLGRVREPFTRSTGSRTRPRSGARVAKRRPSNGARLRSSRRPISVPLCLRGLSVFVIALFFSGLADAQTRPWPLERPPAPLAARDIKFPPYEIQTLPNGLQVVAVLHHEQPAVTMLLLVRAGTSSDPKDKLGLAHLAASLLDQGTTTKSAEEMNDAVDFIGGAMGAGAGTDLTFT